MCLCLCVRVCVGRDGETAQGNNSANGVTVWIFSRSRKRDYDLAISVTRFY